MRVDIDADHPVFAVFRLVGEPHVPLRSFDRVDLSGRDIEARQPGELAPLIGREVEIAVVAPEALRVELYIRLMWADLALLARLPVANEELVFVGSVVTLQRQPLPIIRRHDLVAGRV